MKSKFKHDCTRCTFLGTVWVQSSHQSADLYKSCGTIDPGFILRFSSKGPDYICVPEAQLGRRLTAAV